MSNTPAAEEYVYVRDRATMESLIERIRDVDRVALDTEADSLHSYFEKVCLIQLSLAGGHYIVDPLADLDMNEFLNALAGKPLILHGADYDLRMMRASLGFRPSGEVFDTMIAAQLLGIEQIGLVTLIEKFVGVTIGKEGQKSDWSRRPLSEQQLRYAVNDTRFLEQLAECLGRELIERGRLDWHAQSCRAMVESTGRQNLRDPEQAWRIKGSARLTRRQLGYLRELWHWRDQQARRANRPAFKIFGNEQMVELLLWAESHPGDPLEQGPRLPRNIYGSRLRSLEEAIARAAAMRPEDWPEPKMPGRGDASLRELKEQAKALRDDCARIAADLDIAASTLAPRAALEAIARNRPRNTDEMMKMTGLLRWQAELVQAPVERFLRATEKSLPGN